MRCDQTTFEVFHRFPFRMQGVGVTDVEVHTAGRTARIVLGPLGEVESHRSAVCKTIALRSFVGAGVESESAVAFEGGVEVSDGDDR